MSLFDDAENNGGDNFMAQSPDYCDGARAKAGRRKRRSLLLPAPMSGQNLLASCDGDSGGGKKKEAAAAAARQRVEPVAAVETMVAPATPRTMTRRFVASTSSSEKRTLAEEVREGSFGSAKWARA